MSDSEKDSSRSLFGDFPAVSTQEWEQIIARDLKGADYKEKLRWETGEGITPLPFYRREDLNNIDRSQPIEKEGETSWNIREVIFQQDVAAANEAAREAINGGTYSLQFNLQVLYTDGMLGGDLAGTAIRNQQHFSDFLNGINLHEVPVHFDSGLATPVLLGMLWNHLEDGRSDPGEVKSTFSYDPFKSILMNGRLPKEINGLRHDIQQMGDFSNRQLPGCRPLAIDGRTYHDTGATLVEELGFAIATASEYMAILTDDGLEANEAARQLNFYFSTGSNYFLEIAKFRAARLLWQQLIEAYGGKAGEVPAYIHGETSRRNKTLYDPYNNMLRTTTEAMSAAMGGCDSVTVRPFDEHFRSPDEFSQRMARNSQIIMDEEAFLGKVDDPGAGSYYIEQLTNDIAREAWSFFQEVEQVGGMLQAIRDNFVQATIEESQQQRNRAIAKREKVFVGTNKYPNPEDRMADKYNPDQPTVSLDAPEGEPSLDKTALIPSIANGLGEGATLEDFIPYLFEVGKHDIRQLQPYHGAAAFEQLRLATETHDSTPVVLTLPVGNPQTRKARSSFAANFMGCAGYKIKEPLGFDSAEDALVEMGRQSPDIVVLCSSDEEYKELVPAACELAADMESSPILVVSGNPSKNIRSYRKAGIDEFIHSESNVLEVLQDFHKKLGITEYR